MLFLLSPKAKTFLHQLNFKVSFSSSEILYTSLRPREPAIKGKYGVPYVVYKYHCSACDKRYIGYTTRPIIRSSEHFEKIQSYHRHLLT